MKKFLLEDRGNICENCGNHEWCGKNIPLDMDHEDGNPENWSLQNLRLLCPNCHAQTPTYKGANRGNGRFSRRERYQEGKSF